MELINQHSKAIMEGCKVRARDAGLSFTDESLEYIVTNRDLLELSPKVMIPTLYDYWVHDVEVLQGKGKYAIYPHNPYETVINTRPPISFYNDNNPDWLNVMIFYHVLGHIDFFQNNLYFRHTWDYDFTGEALSDKRLISRLRAEKGHWVDYVIEFARAVDNLVDYHGELSGFFVPENSVTSGRLNYYFDIFLQEVKGAAVAEYVREVGRYNDCLQLYGELAEKSFFTETGHKYPEFEALYHKAAGERPAPKRDLLRYLLERSPFLKREENLWMKQILEIVRKTSVFFQPQIRTKIMNEGWASYWHEYLFLRDDRIRGHEVDFARVHAGVTAMPRVGMNPYALGMRLFTHLEEQADKGKLSFDYRRLKGTAERQNFDRSTGSGREHIFRLRENLCDYIFLKDSIDQDFTDRHNLFVAGKRLDQQRQVWQYYVKSRKAADYRQMVLDSLYHPPSIAVVPEKGAEDTLYLLHRFEGKQLIKEYITNTMLAIEYLWGGPVHLETSEAQFDKSRTGRQLDSSVLEGISWQRIVYRMQNKTLGRITI